MNWPTKNTGDKFSCIAITTPGSTVSGNGMKCIYAISDTTRSELLKAKKFVSFNTGGLNDPYEIEHMFVQHSFWTILKSTGGKVVESVTHWVDYHM